MARKNKKTVEEENAALADAACYQATFEGLKAENLKDVLPDGFLKGVHERLPEKIRGTWQENSMSSVWKQRKAALIPMIANLMREPDAEPGKEDLTNVVQVVESKKPFTVGEEGKRQDKINNVVNVGQNQRPDIPVKPEGPTPEELQKYLDRLEEKLTALGDMKTELSTLVKEEVRAVIDQVQPIPTSEGASIEEPPVPPKDGKKQLGDKAIINVRVDANLQALFAEDVKRCGGNASRAMDKLLWNYYGKPKLSFETDEPQEQGDLGLE